MLFYFPAFQRPQLRVMVLLCAGTGLSVATPLTEVSTYVGANTTVDYQKSTTGAPLTSTRSRPGSSITIETVPGSVSILASAVGSSTTPGIAQGNGYAQDTYTITGGTGSGTATFTFYLSGRLAASRTFNSLATYDVGFDYNGSLSGRSDQNADSGSHPPQTIVFTRGFTYGVPFDLLASLSTNLSAPNGSTCTADLTLRCAGYSVNGAASYTGTSSAGTTKGTMLAPGTAYDGFTLANTKGRQSVLTLRDGDAAAQRNLAVNFMAPDPDLPVVSDIVDVKGTGTDLVVIQLSYDSTAASTLFQEIVMLGWWNPISQLWQNAVLGNFGGGNMFKDGPYDPATDLVLGKWGIDRKAKVVWAVVNHNSQFAVVQGTQPPPPTNYAGWMAQNFTEEERGVETTSGPSADPDADGFSNFLEYAFVADPRKFSPPPVGTSFITEGASTYLRAFYTRRNGVTDLVLEPQFSSNLGVWTAGTIVGTTENFDGSETVISQDNAPMAGLAGGRFVRVKVNP